MSTTSLNIETTRNGDIKIGDNEYSKFPSDKYVALRLITDQKKIDELTSSNKLVKLPDNRTGEVVPNTDVITLEKVSYNINKDENTINKDLENVNDESSGGGKYAPFFLKSFKSSKKNKKTKCRKIPRKLNTRRRK